MGKANDRHRRFSQRLLSTRSKKLILIEATALAVFHETFPWTTQHGWSYAEMITDSVNWLFKTSILLDTVYEWEARILALTADLAFVVLIVVLSLWFYEVFVKREKSKDDSKEVKAIQRLNKDIKREFRKLRMEIKANGNKEGGDRSKQERLAIR